MHIMESLVKSRKVAVAYRPFDFKFKEDKAVFLPYLNSHHHLSVGDFVEICFFCLMKICELFRFFLKSEGFFTLEKDVYNCELNNGGERNRQRQANDFGVADFLEIEKIQEKLLK